MKRLIISIVIAVVLVIGPASGALAATSANVSITAQPGFIAIANTPDNWTINDVGLAGGKSIAVDTIYYSNTQGDTSAPSPTVADNECHFAVTNTSGINIIITVNFPDHASGDASTNSDLGTNDTTKFGAYSYTSYTGFNTFADDKVIAQVTGSDPLLTTGTAGDEFFWGLMYESQSDAWTSGTAMTSTVVISAAPA